jgi:hypothetical protein
VIVEIATGTTLDQSLETLAKRSVEVRSVVHGSSKPKWSGLSDDIEQLMEEGGVMTLRPHDGVPGSDRVSRGGA